MEKTWQKYSRKTDLATQPQKDRCLKELNIVTENLIFQKNYDALLHEYPNLARKVDRFISENKTVIDQFLNDQSANSCVSARAVEQELDNISLENNNFIVMLGIGPDNFFIKLRAIVAASTTILIIEKELANFVRSLYLYDFRSLIEGWQVKFIIAQELSKLETYCGQYYFPIDRLGFIRNTDDNPEYYTKTAECITAYAKKRVARPEKEKKYRFLVMAGKKGTGWPYIMQDIIAGLHKLGHTVRILHLEVGNFKYQFRKEVSAHRPDYIMLLDAIGLMHDEFNRENIPYISWFFDNPFNWLKPSHISDNYLIFVWDKTYVDDLRQAGFKHVYYLPLAANPSIFYPREPKMNCDISFAGSSLWSPQPPPFDHESKKIYITLLAKSLCKAPWVSIWSIIEQLNHKLGINFKLDDPSRKREFELFVQNFARTIYRNDIIQSVLEFNPHLYGDNGWRNSVADGRGVYLGRINNRLDLPVLYSSSSINLNITVPQLRDSFSHRAFEIPACGGFLLSDYRPQAKEFFELDKEIVCFKNTSDLKDKIRYFLKHPEERKHIAQKGMERVLAQHTYHHRLKKMLRFIHT